MNFKYKLFIITLSFSAFSESFFFTRDLGKRINERENCRSIKGIDLKVGGCNIRSDGTYLCIKSEMYELYPFSSKKDCEIALKSARGNTRYRK